MMQNTSYLCIAKRAAGHGVNSNQRKIVVTVQSVQSIDMYGQIAVEWNIRK